MKTVPAPLGCVLLAPWVLLAETSEDGVAPVLNVWLASVDVFAPALKVEDEPGGNASLALAEVYVPVCEVAGGPGGVRLLLPEDVLASVPELTEGPVGRLLRRLADVLAGAAEVVDTLAIVGNFEDLSAGTVLSAEESDAVLVTPDDSAEDPTGRLLSKSADELATASEVVDAVAIIGIVEELLTAIVLCARDSDTVLAGLDDLELLIGSLVEVAEEETVEFPEVNSDVLCSIPDEESRVLNMDGVEDETRSEDEAVTEAVVPAGS